MFFWGCICTLQDEYLSLLFLFPCLSHSYPRDIYIYISWYIYIYYLYIYDIYIYIYISWYIPCVSHIIPNLGRTSWTLAQRAFGGLPWRLWIHLGSPDEKCPLSNLTRTQSHTCVYIWLHNMIIYELYVIIYDYIWLYIIYDDMYLYCIYIIHISVFSTLWRTMWTIPIDQFPLM